MNSKELLPFFFLIGVLLFNWPLLDIFSISLPYYIFSVWGLFIVVVGVLITLIRRRDTNRDV